MPARCRAFTMSRNSSTGPSGVAARAVGRVRREERDRLVAPVVDLPRRARLGVELEHRQQLDGGDAELLEIRDLLDQPGVSAAGLLPDPGARVAGEPADVHLVDDGARRRAGTAGGPPPSRTRPDRRPRSSSPSRRCRPPASRPRGRSPSGRPRPGRTGRAGPWRGRTAARARGPTAPRPGSRRSAPARTPRHEHVPVVVGAVRRRIDPDHAGRGGVVLPVEEQRARRPWRSARTG